MDHSTYIRGLLSVMVGLGLAAILQSFHKLWRMGGRVRWDWLPVTWAVLAFLMVVQTWWAYFTILRDPRWINLFAFLLPLSVFVLLFLICASALPEAKAAGENEKLDLASFYLGQRRVYFTFWALLLVLAVVVSAITRGRLLSIENGFRLAGLAAAILLTATARRRVHAVITLGAVAVLLLYIALYSMRLP